MEKKPASPGISFADAEFESFQMYDRENILLIYLTSWDERELRIVFSNPIQFSYKLGDVISVFYEIQEDSTFLNEALLNHYEKIPPSHPFKLFQIWDIKDFPFINVVAESVKVTKGDIIVGFRS